MPTPASRRRSAATDAMGVLLALAVLYGAMSFLVYRVIHMRHVAPLGPDALPGEFSEGRVLQHLRRLAVDIPGRQEGSPGLEAAAQYIKGQLEGLAAHAGPQYRVEVEETLVSGSFSMMFLRHRVTLGYRNHKNIVMRRVYWKNRCTIRWVKLGGESTKFFHAAATKSYRRNKIPSLISNDGISYSDHDTKAAIIWNTFSKRLGHTDKPIMHFCLEDLINRMDRLDSLSTPFTDEEIDNIIKALPADRAPGPDGFNGLFLKRC